MEEIHQLTKVKVWFIQQMKELVEEEEALLKYKGGLPTDEMLTAAKKDGFSDKYLSRILEIPEDQVRERRIAIGVEENWEGVPCERDAGQRILLFHLQRNGQESDPHRQNRKS